MAPSKRRRPKSDSPKDRGNGEKEEPKFRLRPRAPRRSLQGDMSWSIALRTVFRYARSSASASKRQNKSGGAAHPRRAFHQRCAVRVMYSPSKTKGQWRAHGIYIARESATQNRSRAGLGSAGSSVDIASTLDQWQTAGDERIWKVILSPEFGERVNLEQMIREVMKRAEKDLGTSLEWVAVAHFNTQHPHIHLVIRGRRDDGKPLHLPRQYVQQGLRNVAENACTLQLGPRTELDAMVAEEREIQEHRYTSLDRTIKSRGEREGKGDAQYFHVPLKLGPAQRPSWTEIQNQHLAARLAALRQMGLAEPMGAEQWRVRRDFQTVLKAMQLTVDRQKMLAAHGALLSDERLRLRVVDFRHMKELQGRVLLHGEEEQGTAAGRHFLFLEGTDAQIHLMFYTPEMEEARSRGSLKTNHFVRLQKQFVNGQPLLQVDDFGDANELLKDKVFLAASAQRLLRRGMIPSEEGWNGWLGSYQKAVYQAAGKAPQTMRDKDYLQER